MVDPVPGRDPTRQQKEKPLLTLIKNSCLFGGCWVASAGRPFASARGARGT